VSAEEAPLSADAMTAHLLQLHRPLNPDETSKLVRLCTLCLDLAAAPCGIQALLRVASAASDRPPPREQLLYLHATLDKSTPRWQSLPESHPTRHAGPADPLAERLAISCEVLTRIRNSPVKPAELHSTLDTVLAVL
jgi:hypothetical protein